MILLTIYLDGCSWAADVDGALSPCLRLAPRLLNRIGAFCLPPSALACFAFTGDGRPPADILQFAATGDGRARGYYDRLRTCSSILQFAAASIAFVSLCRHFMTSIYVRWKPTRPTSFGTPLLGAAPSEFCAVILLTYAHQGE